MCEEGLCERERPTEDSNLTHDKLCMREHGDPVCVERGRGCYPHERPTETFSVFLLNSSHGDEETPCVEMRQEAVQPVYDDDEREREPRGVRVSEMSKRQSESR